MALLYENRVFQNAFGLGFIISHKMKELKLVLKKKWFDMIASGEKKEEYRDFSEYWQSRLLEKGRWDVRPFDAVTFFLGYTKNRPSITFRLILIGYGEGRPEWGAEPGKKYFIIYLGKRL